MNQGTGRDHHIKGFSLWMAGGGIKPGITYGETDELGYNAVKDVVEVHDLHATMLYLLGHRPPADDFPLSGPRFPPDRRGGEGGAGDFGVKPTGDLGAVPWADGHRGRA